MIAERRTTHFQATFRRIDLFMIRKHPWLATFLAIGALVIGLGIGAIVLGLGTLARDGMPAMPETLVRPRGEAASADPPTAIGVRVADVDLPTQLPLVGPEGTGADGYPTNTADGEALLALLHARRFDELTRHFDAYLAAYREDRTKEMWLLDAAARLGNGDPRNERHLDAWMEAHPRSFAPYAVRGEHRGTVALAIRGRRVSAEVPEANREAMRVRLQAAFDDLDRALELAPDAVPLLRARIHFAAFLGDDARIADARDRAERGCPACMAWRQTYLNRSSPRWGGSHEAMSAFETASLALASENPRLATLRGSTEFDRATWGPGARATEGAPYLAELDRLLSAGPHSFHLSLRAEQLVRMGRFEDALADTALAQTIRPMDPAMLEIALFAHIGRRDWMNAGETAVHVARLAPISSHLRENHDRLGNTLANLAYELLVRNDEANAGRAMELARMMHPPAGGRPGAGATFEQDAAELRRLTAAMRESPDSFTAVLALDQYLASRERWSPILIAWDEYLARHPDDALAHRERAGTLSHMGRLEEMAQAFERSCTLGEVRACRSLDRYRNNVAARR